MKKDELTEAIADGIHGGLAKFLLSLVIGMVIGIILFVVGTWIWSHFTTDKSDENMTVTTQQIDKCQLGRISCTITAKENFFVQYGDISYEYKKGQSVFQGYLCGYQEALSWYQIEGKFYGNKTELICN